MSMPIYVTTTNLGALPVFENAANPGGLSVVLEQGNLGGMPVRMVAFGTPGAVPIIYAGTGYTPPPIPPVETFIRVTDIGDTRVTSDTDTRVTTAE